MRPYGLRRNWNDLEDYCRNGSAVSPKRHRNLLKMCHRRARRLARYNIRTGGWFGRRIIAIRRGCDE
jgi:hypothetical protein